ncbi:L-gulonolactone/D-arabinono-1,4-lactone oxidase [Fomitiporia mediterranea MF3/22]|uniref:L-gulonolactone/D-arabinono-1,4-lactone oxidase n=1 Tax=Fomitiporia mediterranea (strain MF3/22) TaxID=694068 RepID=UPI00044073BB|nr:L-gulonolactone/D-arabinono-1,4-lactone oxidase [Fomitiporia mediterranea MF3/22]EJD04984.1 L-gulonolactone/D-arabinono-1,4-lactone oxidase [Fomitiporia mediterranea MF3/22]
MLSRQHTPFAPLASLSVSRLWDLLQPIIVPWHSPRSRFTNWGRTFTCVPLAIFEPETEEQCALVLELARREGRRVRFSGIGHSPSDLACTNEYMLRTTKLNKVLEVNTEKNYIVAQGGIILNALHACLAAHNLAMSNLGSISDQTLAGIITTATHGTGVNYGVLSTMVLELTLMIADGTQVTCSESHRPDLFKASLCGLGATGLILSAKLQVEPAFRLRDEQDTVNFDTFLEDFDVLIRSGEHTRFWWFAQNNLVRTSVCNRTQESPKPAGSWLWNVFFAYHVVQLLLFLGRYWLRINTWTGLFAEWLLRGKTVNIDDSHRVLNVDCRYPQYTTEWAVPLENARRCLRELQIWIDNEYANPNGIRPHFPIEIRFTEADDIWLSPVSESLSFDVGMICRRLSRGIFSSRPYGFNVPYRRFFSAFERIAAQLGGKPHWAKTHELRPAELRALYPRFPDFVKVLEDVDSSGLFRSEYIRRHIFGELGADVHARVFKPRN